MSRESVCELVRTGKKRKGYPADKLPNGKYSCFGYIDLMYDEPLKECEKCKWFYEKWQYVLCEEAGRCLQIL